MKPTQLHITNGNSTTLVLQKLKIDGEIVTWREMLCEGKTTIDVGSESFWKSRFDFFSSNYKITKKHFIDNTLKEFRNLCNHKSQDEIILWFGYDLSCQINLLAVISWLKKNRPNATIALVSPKNKMDSKKHFKLHKLAQKDLLLYYKNRIFITKDDIEYADYIWQLYCSKSPLQLQNITVDSHSHFAYLPDAIEAHLQRFPTIKNGLNKVENNILETALTGSYASKKTFIQKLLHKQGVYGFNNQQYEKKIRDLKGLFSSFSPVILSDLGHDVLQKKQNYYHSIKNDLSYLGGSLKYNYLYDEIDGRLLKL